MGTLALAADERVAGVKINRDTLTVSLMDGRTISVPLVWYPRLLNATPAQRKNWQIAGGGYGIHWPDVDEDLTRRAYCEARRHNCPANERIRKENIGAVDQLDKW